MEDNQKPAEDAKDRLRPSPAAWELLKARTTGEFPDYTPPDMLRRNEQWAEWARQRQAAKAQDSPAAGKASDAAPAEQEPISRVGPQNPDHPHVNREPDGRMPS